MDYKTYPDEKYQAGNTIRFSAAFRDWDGSPAAPDLVKFIVYDEKFNRVFDVTIGSAHIANDGSYFYDYIPADAGDFVFEWYAEMGGLPSLRREKLTIRKV